MKSCAKNTPKKIIEIVSYVYKSLMIRKLELFNNKDAILNFDHIAMHCGLSMEIQLF